MNKYVLILAFSFIIPMSAAAGNITVARASFTIPQSIEISKEFTLSLEEGADEEGKYKIIIEEERMIAIEEAVRQDQKVVLKTVLLK